MAKKCILCGETAELKIKHSSEFYCRDCAESQFGDLAMLVKLEDDAKKLKKYIDESSKSLSDEEIELNLDEDDE